MLQNGRGRCSPDDIFGNTCSTLCLLVEFLEVFNDRPGWLECCIGASQQVTERLVFPQPGGCKPSHWPGHQHKTQQLWEPFRAIAAIIANKDLNFVGDITKSHCEVVAF